MPPDISGPSDTDAMRKGVGKMLEPRFRDATSGKDETRAEIVLRSALVSLTRLRRIVRIIVRARPQTLGRS